MSKPAVKATKKNPNDYLRELKEAGFNYIDNRSTSGIVWVLYSPDKETALDKILKDSSARIKLERRGAMATKNMPAWRVMFR